MIKSNQFYIKNLTSVVFLGQSNIFSKLINFNSSLKLKTFIITSSHQSKLINKKIKHKIFNKLDNKFKNFIKANTKTKETIFVSLGARYIFKEDTIKNFFLNNLVNFHGTRLPLDAGGGGYSWRIMREDRIDNQLVHIIDKGLDTGQIIKSHISLFPKKCRIPIDFEEYRLEKFYNFYSNFIKEVKSEKHFQLKPQPTYLGRYNPRLSTDIDGLIDWQMNSYDLINFINAFDKPYAGASTYLNNGNFGKLFLKKVQLHGGDSSNHPYMSGMVSRHDGEWIVVSTKSKHMLLIEEVLDRNGKNIIKKVKPGDRFYTPDKELEKSKKTRKFYNSKGQKLFD